MTATLFMPLPLLPVCSTVKAVGISHFLMRQNVRDEYSEEENGVARHAMVYRSPFPIIPRWQEMKAEGVD